MSWFKKGKNDKIWWLDPGDEYGVFVFSFDKKTQYDLFEDYPNKLSEKQLEVFNKENPFWASFFKKEK